MEDLEGGSWRVGKAKGEKAHDLRGRCLKTLAWLHGSVFWELKAGGGQV